MPILGHTAVGSVEDPEGRNSPVTGEFKILQHAVEKVRRTTDHHASYIFEDIVGRLKLGDQSYEVMNELVSRIVTRPLADN